MSRKEARKKSGQLLAAHILWSIVCLRLDCDFYLLAILKLEDKIFWVYKDSLNEGIPCYRIKYRFRIEGLKRLDKAG